MNASFVVYIDESGDEGFKFGQGSSEWFFLSAVIIKKSSDLQTVKLVDDVKIQLGREPKKPLHFSKLKHEQRLLFVDHISKADLKLVTVLIHKPSIKEVEKFQERYRLYFYGVRYLFERISWYCRDHRAAHDVGDGSAHIIFSNRSGMSYDEMKQYLQLLQSQTKLLDVRIEWSIINCEQIESFTPGKRMGLQIADAIASSFYYALENSPYGFTEDRYARMLKPVVYHRKSRYIGYGLKFWPSEGENATSSDKKFLWIKEVYK